jgi:hypothetical protein
MEHLPEKLIRLSRKESERAILHPLKAHSLAKSLDFGLALPIEGRSIHQRSRFQPVFAVLKDVNVV